MSCGTHMLTGRAGTGEQMAFGNGNRVFFVAGDGQLWITCRAVESGASPTLRLQNPALFGAAGDSVVNHLDAAERQLLETAAIGGGFAPQSGNVESQAGQLPPLRGVDAAHRSLQNKGSDYAGARR